MKAARIQKLGDDFPAGWKKVGTIDVADPADVRWSVDRGYRIGDIYDGLSFSVAEPCAADIYRKDDDLQSTRLAREAVGE